MASTWKRDNQALFPVKQSCCFSSPNRKTQQQHASSLSLRVTFGLLEAENKTSSRDVTFGVMCLGGCYFWMDLCVFCICANKQCDAILKVCVITDKSCLYPYLIIQMRTPPRRSLVLSLHLIFFFWVTRFPFHYLLIWKTKSVIDEDEENDVLSTQPISPLQELSTTSYFEW